jgi:HEPN domain-containing protein
MKEISRQWLNFATDDLDTIREIIEIEHLTNIATFHCQQCIEKSFKAILEENELDVPKVHDLVKLYGKVKEVKDYKFNEDVLDILSRIYIEARYPSELGLLPGGKPTVEETKKFYEFTKYVYAGIKKHLEKEENV